MPIITLTTDFGTRDWFVGVMKGVILTIQPQAKIVDITHEIDPGDVAGGAFALAASYSFFPKGSIHVAVVDPGVGSRRKTIAVETANYIFVGPDNGVLALALRREQIKTIRVLEQSKYWLHPVSRTFHGRDIFSSVAAHLSRGVAIRNLGPAIRNYTGLRWPETKSSRKEIEGEVVYIDRFGNGITNIEATFIRGQAYGHCRISRRPKLVIPVRDYYQAVPRHKPVAVFGSAGLLEVAVNGGNARSKLGLKVGTKVTLRNL